MKAEAKIYKCSNCGADLDVPMNFSEVICPYCNAKNVIKEAGIKKGDVTTDLEKMLTLIDFNISTGKISQAEELLQEVILGGIADVRIYILMARIKLKMGNDRILFDTLSTIKIKLSKGSYTELLRELAMEKDPHGLTALHLASYYERLDMVEFLIECGADVNARGGAYNVTPLTILYVPKHPDAKDIYGAPFERDKSRAKEIKNYLKERGAKDSMREYKRIHKEAKIKTANKLIYCTLAFLGGLLGFHKFYTLKILSGLWRICLLASSIYLWEDYQIPYLFIVPVALTLSDFFSSLVKKSDIMGRIQIEK